VRSRVLQSSQRTTATVRRTCQHTYGTEASSQLILFPSIRADRKRVMQIHQEGQGLQKRMLNAQQYRVLAVQRKLFIVAVRGLVHNTRPSTMCCTYGREITCLQNSAATKYQKHRCSGKAPNMQIPCYMHGHMVEKCIETIKQEY